MCVYKCLHLKFVLQCFANGHVLLNITDSDRFGAVMSCAVADDCDETEMLLGDRKQQPLLDLLAQNVFSTLRQKEPCASIKGMTMTVQLKVLKSKEEVKQVVSTINQAL
jgi:hypothetical protein